MDVQKILDGLKGKRKAACETVAKKAMVGSEFWALIRQGCYGAAANWLLESRPGTEPLCDAIWEG